MAKEPKKKSADSSRPASSEREGLPVRSTLKGAAILAIVALCAWGYLRTRNHVEKQVAFQREAPTPRLKHRPAWMSDGVARRILAVAQPDVARSAFDHQLLVNTASLLATHPDTAPWIRRVNAVRRAYEKSPGDILEIDCDFRAPVALVRWADYYWLIDGDGILLPEQYTAADVQKIMYDQWRQPVLRVIEGIAAPAPESGQKWRGQDLAAGIDMIRLLHDKLYANEIERINVANFGGRLDRREAQIVLITRYQTQVRWGRPIDAKDFFVEVSKEQKLLYMEQLVQKFKRVDAGHSAVDLRFDVVTFPSAESLPASASGDGMH